MSRTGTEILWFLNEAIIYMTFLAVCAILLQRRFTVKRTLAVYGLFALAGVGINLGMLLSGTGVMVLLTMLPLTMYLPVILCQHILSRAGFFPTALSWFAALAGYFTMKFIKSFLRIAVDAGASSCPAWIRRALAPAVLVLLSAMLLFVFSRWIRRPFQHFMHMARMNWLVLCLPMFFIFGLFAYFLNSVTDPKVFALLFMMLLSFILVLAKVLTSADKAERLQEAVEAITSQMDAQRRDYEMMAKKLEMGRAYRHDMHHHLRTLESLLGQDGANQAVQYIHSLENGLAQTETTVFCKNALVNAVLSSYIAQAREAGCQVEIKAQVPEQLPFEDADVCIILSNGIENAIHACEKQESGKRRLRVSVALAEKEKMTISLINSCPTKVEFDTGGFPLTPRREGHSIGLKSIEAAVKKYNGVFSCDWKAGEFYLQAVLFKSTPPLPADRQQRRRFPGKKIPVLTGFLLLAFTLGVNALPAFESFHFRWGDTEFSARLPRVEEEEESPGASASGRKRGDEDSGGRADPAKPSQDKELAEAVKYGGSGERTQASPPSGSQYTAGGKMDFGQEPESAETGGDSEEGTPGTEPEPENAAAEAVLTMDSGRISLETGKQGVILDIVPVPEAAAADSSKTPSVLLVEGVRRFNRKMSDYIAWMREKFYWYAARKYEGYVGLDSDYKVLCNNQRMLCVRFDTTINAGGSGQFSRCFTLDKRTGEVTELKDLFKKGGDYVSALSSQVLAQMRAQSAAGTGIYFIPDGQGSWEDCFFAIEADQNFYINGGGSLVLVFDEYAIAPGSMGCPEFVIPTGAIQDLLRQPSLIG